MRHGAHRYALGSAHRSNTVAVALAAVLGAGTCYSADIAVGRDAAQRTSTSMQAWPGRVAPGSTAGLRIAPNHILIELARGARLADVEREAAGRGLRRLGRVYRSRWYSFSLPQGADPRAMAHVASAFAGVARATVDPVVTLLDHVVPHDPLYTQPLSYCDPYVEVCTDQWGLFKVGSEAGWHETTGSPSVVIAVLDSGVDLDHDDLSGNIWTNPGEIAGNGVDDDGNGIVDDVHGADFAGNNVGAASDDPASQDGSPDVPEGGSWVEDPTAYFGLRWDGDAATGDADDNNGDGYPDQSPASWQR